MSLKQRISTWLWFRTLARHRSRMGRRDAPRYTKYAKHAQAAFRHTPGETKQLQLGSQFREQGYTWFQNSETETLAHAIQNRLADEIREHGENHVWAADSRYALGDIYQRFPEIDALFRGTVGDFLRGALGSEFKIFYGIMYRSIHDPDGPSGSQRWHSDAGPGTCINLMFCVSEVGPENGAMEILPWPTSLQLFNAEAKQRLNNPLSGDALHAFYENEISANLSDSIHQPQAGPGLVYPFLNNTAHRGGYPELDQERTVCIFHIYPADSPAPLDAYRTNGIPKTGPYPKDPAQVF